MRHTEAHPLAGQTVKIRPRSALYGHNPGEEHEYHVEDYWDRVTGGSWMRANGNPAALHYGLRGGVGNLPIDDEVLYGRVGTFNHLVHVSEVVTDPER